mmetsp:Transcript_87434/g.276235  ORF Transcript_87434/g.276235 Transcript_87434/m.276235 type:complete len:262 (+) Transcript_87434:53-838(+)
MKVTGKKTAKTAKRAGGLEDKGSKGKVVAGKQALKVKGKKKAKAAKKEVAAGKAGEGEEGQERTYTEAEKEALAEEAIDEIRGFLEEAPIQKDSDPPFVPGDWGARFKGALGPYKQFLLQHPDKFTVVKIDGRSDYFILRQAGAYGKPRLPDVRPWGKGLLRAWSTYCQVVPGPRRDFKEFLGALPKSASAAAAADAAVAAHLASVRARMQREQAEPHKEQAKPRKVFRHDVSDQDDDDEPDSDDDSEDSGPRRRGGKKRR